MDNTETTIIDGVSNKPQSKALDLLFGGASAPTPQTEGVQKIQVEELHTFPNHPFAVREDSDMDALIDSIRQNGVLMPLLVRADPKGGYQLISGHRRTHAARAVGLTEVPAIIEDLTDEAATIQMVDSNLHRERILPSEKAKAYKMRLDAMKRQGKRTDLTSSPSGTKLNETTDVPTCAPMAHKLNPKSRDVLAAQVGESKDQVRRYIRLNHLIPPLLGMVDAGEIPLRAAVELSYCNKGWQEYELDMYQHDTQATVERAETARRLSDADKEGKDLQSMSAIVREERERKERERIEKEEATLRGELRKPRRVVLTEDDLSLYWSELIPSKQVKADLLHILASRQHSDDDEIAWDAAKAKVALPVVHHPDDPYEITCPICGTDLYGGPRTFYPRQGSTHKSPINFCWVCAQRLDWGDIDTE